MKRKYYAITTKYGKRIPAQRTTPDGFIDIPVHYFYLLPEGGVKLIASQDKFVHSKHSSIALVEKHVYEALANIPLWRIMAVVYSYKGLSKLTEQLNEKYKRHEIHIDPSMVKVEVIEK